MTLGRVSELYTTFFRSTFYGAVSVTLIKTFCMWKEQFEYVIYITIAFQTYPSPLHYSLPQKEIVITSLVDQLLLDIYGIPISDKGRSESDSTASSLKPRPQHQYLQKARLLLKSKTIQSNRINKCGEKISTYIHLS